MSVAPGVGNIIKNEALHIAATSPRRLMSAFTDDVATLLRITHAARAYSLAWYRTKRPPCNVYDKTVCVDSAGTLEFCKLGELRSPRPTFWCKALCGESKRGEKRELPANPWEAAKKRVGHHRHRRQQSRRVLGRCASSTVLPK